MNFLYVIFICLPSVFGILSLPIRRVYKNSLSFYDIFSSILWMFFCFFMLLRTYSGSPSFFILESASHLKLTFELEIDTLKALLISVSSILLFLNMIVVNSDRLRTKENNSFFAFVFLGLVNIGIMAKSFYGFFIVTEFLFLIYYIYCCQTSKVQKNGLNLMRYLNLAASAIFISVMLYLGEKSYLLNGSFNLDVDMVKSLNLGSEGILSPQAIVFWGMAFYFFIKLSIFPFYSWSLELSHPSNFVNNLLVSNTTLILFVYSFKKYIVEIFPEVSRENMIFIVFICMFSYLYFHILSIRAKTLTEKIFLMRASCAGLMVGAFFVANKGVDGGVYILLISQVFALTGLYILVYNDEPSSNLQRILLAITLYALAFFPLSGGFVGLYKIVLGYRSIAFYFPILVLLGLLFSLINMIKLFLPFYTKEIRQDSVIYKKVPIFVASICLAIIFVIGIRPMILDIFIM